MADRNIEANPLSSLFIKTRPLQMNTATTSLLLAGQALSPTVLSSKPTHSVLSATAPNVPVFGLYDPYGCLSIHRTPHPPLLEVCVAVHRRRVSQPNGQKHTRRWLPGYSSPNEANACKVRITLVSGLTLSNNHFC
jgi:hypothetical protein